MGDASSLFGGNSLASLFGLGAAAAPATGDAAAADAAAVPANYDPATGLPYPTSTYDPTGTLGAQAAVTGSYTPPAAPVSSSDGDGTQTSNTAGKSDSSQPAAPSGPASVTPQSIAAMMQGQPLPTQPASNPWQPGGGQTPDEQRQAALDALRQGQGIPTGRQAGTPFADRYGQFQPPTSQKPPYFMESAAAGPSGPIGDFPPDETDKTDKAPTPQDGGGKAETPPADTAPPPAAAAPPQPPSPAMGQGGIPGGAGNLLQDIAGLMSGNPMALGKLVQDVMRMAGPPGSQQMLGWNQPFMRPNQASPYTQAGDPSTFGGPQYAGAVPGTPPPDRRPGMFRPGIRTGVARMPPQQYGRTPPGQMQPPGMAPRLNTAPGQTVGTTPQRFNVTANPQGPLAAPSMRSDGHFPIGQTAVGPIVATTLRKAGLNNNAIQGIMYNIHRESSFNPASREADQPKFGGEAHYAHGLYQEGGEEWNNYARWLNGRNWRDPQLQTQFLAENMQKRYPRLWNALKNTQSPEQAAAMFAQYYLRPSAPNLISRLNDIRNGGVRRIGVPTDNPVMAYGS